MGDVEVVYYARKAMIRCGLASNAIGVRKVCQLSMKLQNIVQWRYSSVWILKVKDE